MIEWIVSGHMISFSLACRPESKVLANKKASVGVLLYRRRDRGVVQVFLVHPGGPFWARKDEGAWSIPKGEPGEGEDALTAAKREFSEKTGCELSGSLHPLSPLKQPSGKIISAWTGQFHT